MLFSWFRTKPVHAPTDLELDLFEALEAVTDCVEEHEVCSDLAQSGRQTLKRAKRELGIVNDADRGAMATA